MERTELFHYNSQSGKADSKTPAIITILFFILVGFLAYKFAPPYMKNMDFEQKITEIINWDRFFEGATPPTADMVYNQVMEAAKQLEIPLKDENLVIEELDDSRLKVKLHYEKIISLPIYGDYVWRFDILKVQDLS